MSVNRTPQYNRGKLPIRIDKDLINVTSEIVGPLLKIASGQNFNCHLGKMFKIGRLSVFIVNLDSDV